MTYDITLLRCAPDGITEEMERRTRLYEDGVLAPPISDELKSVWRALVPRLTDAIGAPAENGAYRDHYELAWDHRRIRLWFYNDNASISVPFWYTCGEAAEALHRAFLLGKLLHEITGFEALDEQTGLNLSESSLPAAIQQYTATQAAAQTAIFGQAAEPDDAGGQR